MKMRETNEHRSSTWITWIIVCVFIAFISYSHFGYGKERGLKKDEISVDVQGTSSHVDAFKIQCHSSIQYSSDAHLSDYRFKSDKSDGTYPSSIFPFPKVFTESEQDSHNLMHLTLKHEYWIELNDERTFDSYSLKDYARFCQRHEIIVRQTSPDPNQPLAIHTIKITKSLNHSLSNHYSSEKYVISNENIEGYILKVSSDGIVEIIANSELGVNHALSSLSQLVHSSSSYFLPLTIVDWPESDWRGLMIDVSRHFQPIKLLKRTIDGMERLKLNLLHLHLTDAQSFPILLDDDDTFNLPLSRLANTSTFASDKFYTKTELKQLMKYAQERRIEIIPEIDVPAHSHSWGKAFEGVIVNCSTVARREQNPLNVYPLDPSNPKTFQIIRSILKQIIDIFPSKYLHIGGDEVIDACWSELPHIRQWVKEQNLTIHGITKYFENQVFDIVKDLDKVPIVWQGVFDAGAIPDADGNTRSLRGSHQRGTFRAHRGGNHHSKGSDKILHGRLLTEEMQESDQPVFVSPLFDGHQSYREIVNESDSTSSASYSTIVEPWKCWSGLAVRTANRAVKSGHPVFMSTCWYLDFNSDWTTYLIVNLIDSAKFELYNMDNFEPISNVSEAVVSPTFPASQHDNYFVGGEGALWTEQVDHTNYECRLWPRAGAIAYRLWGFGSSFCDLLYSDLATIPSQISNDSTAIYYYYFCQNYYTPNFKEIMAVSTSSQSQLFQWQVFSKSKNERNRYLRYPFNNEKIEIPITLLATKILYASFTNYRNYLVNHLKINAAPIVFHHLNNEDQYAVHQKSGFHNHQSNGKPTYMPSFPKSSSEIFREISRINRGVHLTSAGMIFYSEEYFKNQSKRYLFRISAQCLGIPEEIQRPITSSRVSVMQFNIADGSVGERGELMLKWLQEKAKQGVMILGFCELVGWQVLFNKEEITRNLPLLALRAANAGFIYSHITQYSSKSSYPVGIVSIYPFHVVQEYYYPVFQRVVLHVYYPKFDLNVLICHLHAHSSEQRFQESQYIVNQILKPLFNQTNGQAKVILMGDLNTLSPYDRKQHEEVGLVKMISENSGSSVFQRWNKKFLIGNQTTKMVDYRPMESLLSAGLVDSCVESCCEEFYVAHPSKTCPMIWSMKDKTNEFTLCMQKNCAGSEPTAYNPEWPQNEIGFDHPLIRLDYILMTRNLFSLNEVKPEFANGKRIAAGVEISEITQKTSDHFPVYASWLPGTNDACSNNVEHCYVELFA